MLASCLRLARRFTFSSRARGARRRVRREPRGQAGGGARGGVAESEIKSFTSKKRRGSERQTGHTHARANTATQENRKRKNTKHSIPSITYEIHPRDRSQPPSSARCVACNVACGSRRPASPRSVSNVRARSRVAVGGRRGLARFQPGMHTQRHTTRAPTKRSVPPRATARPRRRAAAGSIAVACKAFTAELLTAARAVVGEDGIPVEGGRGGVLHAARSGGSIAANRSGRRGLARPCLCFSAAGSAAAGPARHCIVEHRASSFMHAREQEHIRKAASANTARHAEGEDVRLENCEDLVDDLVVGEKRPR
jgi:hypothetical protein